MSATIHPQAEAVFLRGFDMPRATLRQIYAAAVELVTCEAPSRFYAAAPTGREAEALRHAWRCLGAARQGRIAAADTDCLPLEPDDGGRCA